MISQQTRWKLNKKLFFCMLPVHFLIIWFGVRLVCRGAALWSASHHTSDCRYNDHGHYTVLSLGVFLTNAQLKQQASHRAQFIIFNSFEGKSIDF